MQHNRGAIGRYQLLEEIGRGAMGVVYRAFDPNLERDVAIKTISGVLGEGPAAASETAQRFEREARMAARLRHPNIVAVYDSGRDGDRLYLVLERVEGESLGDRLARGEFPPLSQVLDIATQTAEALAAAHRAGIVHRDIKPGNLLIGRDGRVQVTDFGIAKALGETSELTRSGMVVGSPAYLSPEQLQGLPIDGRSDLFSLGVVIFELVLRRKPFAADSFTALVYQILNVDPAISERDLQAMPHGLADLLRDALAKRREDRVPDAQSFAERLRRVSAALGDSEVVRTAPTQVLPAWSGTEAPTRPASRRPVADARRRPLLWVIAAAALAATLAITVRLSERPTPPEVGAPPTQVVEPSARPLPQPEPASAPVARPAPAIAAEPAARPTTEPRPKEARPADDAAEAATPSAAPGAEPPAEQRPAAAPPARSAPAPPISETYRTRATVEFDISPEEALVTVDGVDIGIADDWDGAGGGQVYRFREPGEHLVRFRLEGYRTTWIRVVVDPSATDDDIEIETELEEAEDP